MAVTPDQPQDTSGTRHKNYSKVSVSTLAVSDSRKWMCGVSMAVKPAGLGLKAWFLEQVLRRTVNIND